MHFIKRLLSFSCAFLIIFSFSESVFAQDCNHEWDYENAITVSPDCENSGSITTYCKYCNAVSVETLKPLGHNHNLTVKAVNPTCTKNGNAEYKKCSRCFKVFSLEKAKDYSIEPSDINSLYKVDEPCVWIESNSEYVLFKLGHRYDIDGLIGDIVIKGYDATCTTDGKTDKRICSACNQVVIKSEIIPKKGHTVVIDKAVAPTTKTTGLTKGKHCSVCNAVLEKQKVIAKHTHSYKIKITKQATCTTNGTKTYTCSCGKNVTKTINKKGHSYKWVVTKDATYLSRGKKCYKCTRCNKKIKTDFISKLTLKTPNFSVKAINKGFKVGIKRVNDTTGYQICYIYKGKKYYKTYRISCSIVKSVKQLNSGNYKIYLRAFKDTHGKRVYSKWSNPKTVKIK